LLLKWEGARRLVQGVRQMSVPIWRPTSSSFCKCGFTIRIFFTVVSKRAAMLPSVSPRRTA